MHVARVSSLEKHSIEILWVAGRGSCRAGSHRVTSVIVVMLARGTDNAG